MGLIRARLQAASGEPDGLTLASMRAALVERGGASLKAMLDQQIDQPTDMDLLIGLPQARGGQWAVALRNTGSVDANVTVAATTATGQRLTAQAVVPAKNFSEALFTTSARITRVEVDPEKNYPQIDYSNDIAPRPPEQTGDALSEAAALFVRQNYAGAESAARALLVGSPGMQEARILLARSLLAQNKTDEAEKEFRALVDERLPTPASLAWGNIGLAEISLRKGQAAEAARRFNEAARSDAEYASTLNARQGRIKAETTANALPAIDESFRTFITQLDTAIKSGRKTELDTVILPGELVDFVKGIIGSQPEAWQTRIVRAEMLDANRAALDVNINARQFGRDLSGTAVLILARVGSGWRLAGIEFFEVR
jgi:tetratricopeptide (TPR) repeat protein